MKGHCVNFIFQVFKAENIDVPTQTWALCKLSTQNYQFELKIWPLHVCICFASAPAALKLQIDIDVINFGHSESENLHKRHSPVELDAVNK